MQSPRAQIRSRSRCRPTRTSLAYFYAEGPNEDVVVDGETVPDPGDVLTADLAGLDGSSIPVDLKPSTCGLVEYRYPRWSPTGDRIAVVRGRQDVRGGPVVGTDLVVIDVATSAETVLATRAGDAITGSGLVARRAMDRVHGRLEPVAGSIRMGPGSRTLVRHGSDPIIAPALPRGRQPDHLRADDGRARPTGVSTAKGTVVDVSPWIVDAAGGAPGEVPAVRHVHQLDERPAGPLTYREGRIASICAVAPASSSGAPTIERMTPFASMNTWVGRPYAL